ncbi:hypothetical protein ACFLR9_01770 [Bacteroidota bacterium]
MESNHTGSGGSLFGLQGPTVSQPVAQIRSPYGLRQTSLIPGRDSLPERNTPL